MKPFQYFLVFFFVAQTSLGSTDKEIQESKNEKNFGLLFSNEIWEMLLSKSSIKNMRCSKHLDAVFCQASKKLKLRRLGKASLDSSFFKDYINVHTLVVHDSPYATSDIYLIIDNFSKLKNFELTDAFSEIHIVYTKLKNIKTFKLFRTETSDIVPNLCTLTNLKKLQLRSHYARAHYDSIIQLSQLTNLQDICIPIYEMPNSIHEKYIQLLEKLSNLKTLHLTQSPTDETLTKYCTLTYLSTLIINGRDVLTNEGLKELSKLENLTYLRLSSTKINEEGLKHLTNLKNVRKIVLRKQGNPYLKGDYETFIYTNLKNFCEKVSISNPFNKK